TDKNIKKYQSPLFKKNLKINSSKAMQPKIANFFKVRPKTILVSRSKNLGTVNCMLEIVNE
ncbi:MAG: hypothetical protein AAB740_00940, partial [Patescibacteria group bacterium]